MKNLCAILMMLALAGSALAQGAGYGGTLGVYFSETQFDQSTTELHIEPVVPFTTYVVLTDAQFDGVRGYECSIEAMHTDIFYVGSGGPAGWINFGSPTDYMVGYGEPVPVDEDGNCVLGWIQYLLITPDQVDIVMGGSSLESIPGWDGPAMIFDHDTTAIYHLDLSSGAHGYPDVVARVNPDPVAVEVHSLSAVKSLFE